MTVIVLACCWLIVTRGQYSIDIFGGLVFGHYFWLICEKFAWILDFEWFHQPFHLRHPCFQKKCSKCMVSINDWALHGSEQSISYEHEMLQKHKSFGDDEGMKDHPIDEVLDDNDESKMI